VYTSRKCGATSNGRKFKKLGKLVVHGDLTKCGKVPFDRTINFVSTEDPCTAHSNGKAKSSTSLLCTTQNIVIFQLTHSVDIAIEICDSSNTKTLLTEAVFFIKVC
jgi:hypothetical protein